MNSDLKAIKLSTSPAVFWWRPACWLRATGPDAAVFLQGQFTNDLRSLPQAPAVYGLWLSVKGKVVADSFVLRGSTPDEFWIGSYFSPAAVVRERLDSHIIADDVTLDDVTEGWAGVSLVGLGAAAAMARPGREGVVFPGRRAAAENVEWVYPIRHDASVRGEFGSHRVLAPDEMLRLRIDAAIPAVPADVGPADLPNEGELETDALSYTKGCYLGQEVMARLKTMGQVRRRLLRVHGSAVDIPAMPAPLFAGGRQLGELRSAVREEGGGFVGFAMLSLLHLTPTTELALAPEAKPAVRVTDAPWTSTSS